MTAVAHVCKGHSCRRSVPKLPVSLGLAGTLLSPKLSHVCCGDRDESSQAQRRVPSFLGAVGVGVVYLSTSQGHLPGTLGSPVTELWAEWEPQAAWLFILFGTTWLVGWFLTLVFHYLFGKKNKKIFFLSSAELVHTLLVGI